ncbi:MAG: septum formation initiator family protein [Victivallales bacterium]|nr:septum formation initiator family protein [Victivallales bacterium]
MKKFLQIIFIALLAALAAISVALIFPAFHKYKTMKTRQQEVTEELNKHKNQCIQLRRELHSLENNTKKIEKIAREKFNYCKPKEKIYKFNKEKID